MCYPLNVNEQIILDEIKSICFNGMITIWNKSRKKKTHPPLPALCLQRILLSCRQHTSCRYAPLGVDDNVPLRFLLQKQKRDINRIFPKKDGKSTFLCKRAVTASNFDTPRRESHVLCRNGRKYGNSSYCDRIYFYGFETG